MQDWLIHRVCLTTFLLLPSIGFGASSTPHPAVVRIVAPEQDGTAYGSGTLIDVREDFGLVLTNWHVVCDAKGPIEVIFPSGFVSQARSIKMDSEWDLAALVIWRPRCEPVKLATKPPRPGDRLTICGYGSGNYRAVTGRCTQFYAPRLNLPQELVELDVQARQGDSGGPIFNDRGELAGVLFGAGQGTTLGSFEGRVKTFLASLAPDIGQPGDAPQIAMRPVCPSCPQSDMICQDGFCCPQGDLGSVCFGCDEVAQRGVDETESDKEKDLGSSSELTPPGGWGTGQAASTPEGWPRFKSDLPSTTENAPQDPPPSAPIVSAQLFESVRNGLAIVGVLAIAFHLVKLAS